MASGSQVHRFVASQQLFPNNFWERSPQIYFSSQLLLKLPSRTGEPKELMLDAGRSDSLNTIFCSVMVLADECFLKGKLAVRLCKP